MHISSVLRLSQFVALFLSFAGVAPADEKRVVVGKSQTPTGGLLAREGADRPWHYVRQGDSAYSRDELLAPPGMIARLVIGDDAATLNLIGSMPRFYAQPVLESAVILHANPDVTLDFTLRSGRVWVSNGEKAARVRVRVRNETWDLNLTEPNSAIAMELYGRWPRGVPFDPDPKKLGQPTASLVFFVSSGQVDLKAGARQHALRPPPGPARFHWDSVAGNDTGPQRQEKEPITTPRLPADREAAMQLVADFGLRARERPAPEALADMLAATDRHSDKDQAALTRDFAVYAMGALDDLPRLTGTLEDTKHAEVRATAVEALRHWIGKAPGKDLVLYKFLIDQQKYSPAQAETVLQLLHTPGDEDVRNPLTYDLLLAYLGHERLPIRELAHWHLARLVTGGRDVKFDAAAPAEQRAAGTKEFKQRVQEMLKKTKPEKE